MNTISFVFTNKGVDFILNTTCVYSRTRVLVITDSLEEIEFPLHTSNNSLYANLGEYGTYTERIVEEQNVLVGNITLQCASSKPFILVCPFDFPKSEMPPYIQIPGFLYGTNNAKGTNGKQPKFSYLEQSNQLTSQYWYTRADRSTHNCVIKVDTHHVCSIGIDERMHGIDYCPTNEWLPKYAYNGLFVDTRNENSQAIGFTLGYVHAPYRYTWVWEDPKTPDLNEYTHGFIYNGEHKTLTTRCYYFADTAHNGIPSYGKALHAHYNQIHTPPQVRATRTQAMELCIDAILKHGWNTDHNFFILSDNGEDGRNRGNIGWTGGMQVAYPILKAGMRLQNKTYISCAESYINTITSQAMNTHAGLLFEEFRDGSWCVDGWWGQREDCYNWGDNPLHSAYCNGQAAYYLLRAFVDTGSTHAQWLSIAQTVCDTALSQQLESGAYARFYSPHTGKGVDYTGFQACWFVPAMIQLYNCTGMHTYLHSAQKALAYYTEFHKQGELYGTPMDTHEAVDEEGNLAYVIACVEMHKITSDQLYIDLACIGLDYEFSWKFAYNTVFSNEPLRSLAWCSCGGSITSTHNPHIHPMGNLIAGEMYYMYKHTHNPYIAQRLKDTCIWGLSTFNSPSIDFGFGESGFQTEQFFHSDALLLPWWKKHDGGIWEAYLPWASGCIILNAAEEIPDEFFEN
ncbi:MAG: hypothetical protein BWY22_02004 [Bacteroidetes bacterium ADurb.Bin217]|nr:MAG: hypothetical protein BWY22_02004 [Bacteroidetes bacterium ADurb.Bin217]